MISIIVINEFIPQTFGLISTSKMNFLKDFTLSLLTAVVTKPRVHGGGWERGWRPYTSMVWAYFTLDSE